MSYLGRKGAVAPLTSGDIPDGVIEGRDIAFFENASGQDLSGTYSTERMYLAGRTGSAPNDYNYKLVGNIDVTGHLALGTIADDDVVITQDSTERTITGSGTLESGDLLHRGEDSTDLTGMTGELGSAVNLNSATFPAGHVINTKSSTRTGGFSTTNSQEYGVGIPDLNVNITPKFVTSKILVMVSLGYLESTGTAAGDAVTISLWRSDTLIAQIINLGYDTASLESFGTSINFLDDPDTISLLNYNVTIKSRTGSTVRVDYHAASASVSSSIIVMEIAQ